MSIFILPYQSEDHLLRSADILRSYFVSESLKSMTCVPTGWYYPNQDIPSRNAIFLYARNRLWKDEIGCRVRVLPEP